MLKKKDVNPNTQVIDIIPLFQHLPPGGWPVNFHQWDNVQAAFRAILGVYIDSQIEEYPDDVKGRGIVVCGGLTTKTKANMPHGYIPSLWVALNKIRLLGCKLPIEIWHIGKVEMDPNIKRLFNTVIKNVTFRDAQEVLKRYPSRMMAGWELKTYAAKYTQFQEFIQLDADNAPHQIDLTEMFTWHDYVEHGAFFWPDFKPRWPFSHAGIYGVTPFPDEYEFESGQMIINKQMCWRELCVAHFLSEYSDYTYKTFFGDKESFHLGWRILGTSYGMPMDGPGWKTKTILQYAPRTEQEEQRLVWLHRCQGKFQLHNSPRFNGIPDENVHHDLLAQLPKVWSGRAWYNHMPNHQEQEVTLQLVNKVFQYTRYHSNDQVMDTRPMLFDMNGVISVGSATCEASWSVWELNGNFYIAIIHQDNKLTALLQLSNDRTSAIGYWEEFERCKVTLVTVDAPPDCEERRQLIARITQGPWQYTRFCVDNVSVLDTRQLTLTPNGTIDVGSGECERTWTLGMDQGKYTIRILHANGTVTCELQLEDDRYVGRWLNYEKCLVHLARVT